MAEDDTYRVFCDRIRTYATRFDDDAIVTYLTKEIVVRDERKPLLRQAESGASLRLDREVYSCLRNVQASLNK